MKPEKKGSNKKGFLSGFFIIWIAMGVLINLDSMSDEGVGILVTVIAIGIVAFVVIKALMKKRREQGTGGAEFIPHRPDLKSPSAAEGHSHDRLTAGTGGESDFEHYKKQLDSFLANGIIERAEYRQLMEKYRKR